MVKKEGKSFWKSRIGGQVKRVTSLTMAATIALSMSTVANVVSKVSPGDSLAVPVVHAQGQNMMNVDEILTNFHINHNDEYEHWTHKLQNDGDISLDGPEFDLTDVTYVVKFPNELAHLLDDNYVIDYLTGKMTNFDYTMNPFNITGIVIDENGEEISIQKDRDKPYNYISINKATNSIEFDFKRFYDENNYEPYIRQSVSGEYFFNNLGFETPIIVPDSRMLKNGTYEFKTAIVRGKSVDLDQVSNAYSIDLVVDYSTDPDPEPEPEPEPEDPVVDKSELEALVDAAQGFDADDYTEESFAALTAALEDAQAVLNNEDATQEEVDVALAALQEAIDGLVETEEPTPEPEDPVVDKSELEALVDEAQGFDADDYTEESFAALTAALEDAQAVLNNEDATQEEVGAALAALQEAIDGLVETEEPTPKPDPEVDKSELEALVEKAKAYDAENYTEASFAKLKDALEVAEGVLNYDDVTQEEVDEALAGLQKAIDGLVKDKKESLVENEQNGDGNKLPNTATSTYNMLLAGFVALLTGAIGLTTRLFTRRKKVN